VILLERIDRLEERVDKIEDKIEPLTALPALSKMMIEEQKNTNVNIKELNNNMHDNFVSEKICNERCGNQKKDIDELKKFRIASYISIIGFLVILVKELLMR
jgi:hypothetical protein